MSDLFQETPIVPQAKPAAHVEELIAYLLSDRPRWQITPELGRVWQQQLGAFTREELAAAGRSWLATAAPREYPTVGAIRSRVLLGTRLSNGVGTDTEYDEMMRRRPAFDLEDEECRREFDLWAMLVRGDWRYYSQAHAIHLRWKVPGEGNEPTSQRLERIRHAENERNRAEDG